MLLRAQYRVLALTAFHIFLSGKPCRSDTHFLHSMRHVACYSNIQLELKAAELFITASRAICVMSKPVNSHTHCRVWRRLSQVVCSFERQDIGICQQAFR